MTSLYRWGGMPDTITGLPGRIPERVGPPSSLVWTSAADSPFGIAGVDCRMHTQAAICATSELETAETFGRLRDDDWQPELDPDALPSTACRLVYPGWPRRDEGFWYRAVQMEDKFDVLRRGDHVFVRSSWTGNLWLVGALRDEGDALVVERVWGGDEGDVPEPALRVRQLDYILKSHALGWWCPHPLPGHLGPDDPAAIGSYSFVLYGRRAYFGSLDDTTAFARSLDGRAVFGPDA